ncbi:MAG TPA: zf-HC2 domain-containing protein [Acidimicrobiales bacterium]|nr:zf-HC2 domain-containing protein [Acidimicrobiales bacterium]
MPPLETEPEHPSGVELSSLVDGELSSGRAEAVETHVATCDVCSALLAELGQVRSALQVLEQRPPPNAAPRAVAEALAAAKDGDGVDSRGDPDDGAGAEVIAISTADRTYRPRLRLLGAAAAVVLLAAAGRGVDYLVTRADRGSTSAAKSAPLKWIAPHGASGTATAVAVFTQGDGGRPGKFVGYFAESDVTKVQTVSLPTASSTYYGLNVRTNQAPFGINGPESSLEPVYDVVIGSRLVGSAEPGPSGVIEIFGLTKADASTLRRLLAPPAQPAKKAR